MPNPAFPTCQCSPSVGYLDGLLLILLDLDVWVPTNTGPALTDHDIICIYNDISTCTGITVSSSYFCLACFVCTSALGILFSGHISPSASLWLSLSGQLLLLGGSMQLPHMPVSQIWHRCRL